MGCCSSSDEQVQRILQENPSNMQQIKVGPKSMTHTVMRQYTMFMAKTDIMGEGSSSICRRGENALTGEPVAIKVYKEQSSGRSSKVKAVMLAKFRRQIHVLQELQEKFKQPADKRLWHSMLDSVEPSQVFMRLIDYSKDSKGNPGPDPSDNTMYVITEMAQYSMKDLLASLREKKKCLPPDVVKKFCKAIIVAMACLHAKGFVHVDMKPENLMMFSGRLKVIDVDGCVRMNTRIDIQDSSISFSPCYCAPEWAGFLISETDSTILAQPGLDVWSVGMTLCELITHDAVLKPQYGNFLRNAHSSKEAGFLFMEWLSSIKKVPLPRKIEEHDRTFQDLITQWLLVSKKEQRKTCAECLSHPFIATAEWEVEVAHVKRIGRQKRREDPSTGVPVHKGVLFKLNSNGHAMKADHWIQRDMWIAGNYSLCYYSQKENKKLVLIDASKLAKATFETMDAARPFAFRCMVSEDKENHVFGLAAESQEELDEWIAQLKGAGKNRMVSTFRLGERMVEELQAFRITVKNRRQKVAENNRDQFEPTFKAKLWKLKGDGESMREEDWFERDMWIAKNGSLVYFSPKENTDLVYYTAADIARATICAVEDGKTFKPFSFQVQLPPTGGVEFAPGEFAAESDEMREKWMFELRKHSNC